ncbi:hypothetical protein [Oceanobacillus piezotolerans]|uniref:hypothetical protein n=1 Tax=Oceanobacillus piezotolerans TaxID=2448030 RepID=UPI001313F586|nr:hypothetical protein [Oceanobacillus piezotolerans]
MSQFNNVFVRLENALIDALNVANEGGDQNAIERFLKLITIKQLVFDLILEELSD